MQGARQIFIEDIVLCLHVTSTKSEFCDKFYSFLQLFTEWNLRSEKQVF
jgi:hypothetical protein